MGDHRVGLREFTDERTVADLPVSGTIPAWLDGHLLRNGPGRFSAGPESVAHWFDGFALLRRFTVRDGRVDHRARFLRSEAYRHATSRGRLEFPEFATSAGYSLPRRLLRALRGRLTDNAVVDVTRVGGEFAAVTETDRAVAFDPETLATRGTLDRDDLAATTTLAHAHYDFGREVTVGLGVAYGPSSRYVLFRRPRGAADRTAFASIPVDRPAYLHSFALTDRYVVVTEHPCEIRPRSLLLGRPFAESFRWRPERGTRFLVVERSTGTLVAERRSDPFFVFHHANAYEADGEVVVDLVAFEDAGVVRSLYLDRLRTSRVQPPGGRLRRFHLSLSADRVRTDLLHPGPMAFPSIHYRECNAARHRYVYGVAGRDGRPDFPDRLLKVDGETGGTRDWSESDCYPGEPVFVPRPDATAEDDGVVLSVVLDSAAERSFLLVLDAATMTERGRATLPYALPFGFHGQFFRGDGEPVPRPSGG